MSLRGVLALLAGCIAAPAARASAQFDAAVSPFVAFLPATGHSPLAGIAFTMAGNPGFALRMNGRTALRNTYAGSFGAGSVIPPWGADADVMLALSGRPFATARRSAATFVFLGIGAAGADSAESRVVTRNWSYGIGTSLPIGSIADLFADSRWRVARFVLPTASPKPERTKELRFGVTFHFAQRGGAGYR